MKAVIYARYSDDNQREESIEGQLRLGLLFTFFFSPPPRGGISFFTFAPFSDLLGLKARLYRIIDN